MELVVKQRTDSYRGFRWAEGQDGERQGQAESLGYTQALTSTATWYEHVRAHAQMCMRVHVHVRICVCMCTCACVYVCVCMYVCII